MGLKVKRGKVTSRLDEHEVLKVEVKTWLETLTPGQRQKFMAEIITMRRERTSRLISEPDIKALLEETETRADGACLLEYTRIPKTQLLTYLVTAGRSYRNFKTEISS